LNAGGLILCKLNQTSLDHFIEKRVIKSTYFIHSETVLSLPFENGTKCPDFKPYIAFENGNSKSPFFGSPLYFHPKKTLIILLIIVLEGKYNLL
jgi:hypothetical protein